MKATWLLVFLLAGSVVAAPGPKLSTDPVRAAQLFFPKESFTLVDQGTVISGDDIYVLTFQPGKFLGQGDVLCVIQRHPDQIPHAEGIYNLWLGVISWDGKKLLSPLLHMAWDEGDWGVFHGAKRSYLFAAGGTTHNGWSEWSGGQYLVTNQGWQRVWPKPDNYWLDYKVEVHDWGLEILRRYTEHHDQLIPQYRYVPDQTRYWNPRTQQFD